MYMYFHVLHNYSQYMAYNYGTVAAPAQCLGTELQTFSVEMPAQGHKD